MVRWTFSTLDGLESYTVPINPNQADSPLRDQGMSWFLDSSAGFTGIRAKRQPVPWSFSGAVRSQEHYEALTEWARKREKVRIVTDLNELLEVRITGFQPERGAPPRRNVEWRHTYKMSALVFAYETGSGQVPQPTPAVPATPSTSVGVQAPAGTVDTNSPNVVGPVANIGATSVGASADGGAAVGVKVTASVVAPAGVPSTGWVAGVVATISTESFAGLVEV